MVTMGGGEGTRRSSTSDTRSSERGGSGHPTSESETEDTNSEDRCSFSQRIDLSGINHDVLENTNIGEIYPVELRGDRPCVINFDDRIVGSILGSLADRLEECIKQGREYRAEIIEIEGRSCEVRVTNRCLINAEAMLASPNPDALAHVSKDEELNVVVHEDSLCVVDDSERIVGSLAEAWTGVLIKCVESGWEYRASIKKIDGGICLVRVMDTQSSK